MSEFVPVADVDAIPDPGKQTVEIDDRFVVVIHAGGSFYALDDVCTHDDGPLGEGELDGESIICPRHGARFGIKTGAALSMPATKPTGVHATKTEDGKVWVRLSE